MLKDNDAASDAVAASLTKLRKMFDARLYDAAELLVDTGCVFDVRTMQNGRVVAGIARTPNAQAAKHRVYIQYRSVDVGSLDDLTLDGECSCGERSPCLHVAAVSIAAAKSLGRPRENHHKGSDPLLQPTHVASTRSATAQQRLCYLFAASDIERREFSGAREFQLSVWVAQTLVGSRHIQAGACAFVARTSDGNGEYPRYVDAQDREILKALTVQHIDGPWDMIGATGFDLLQRAVATGRALWQSPQGQALRSGAARHVSFAWQALPNGDQRLCCEASGSLDISLAVEPAIYVDTASNECGPLHLPYPLDLLRQYWNSPAVAPEHVAAVNECLMREAHGAAFPKPRALPVRRHARSSLRAKLLLSASAGSTALSAGPEVLSAGSAALSAGPEIGLHFVYNGMAVDSDSLRPEQDTVRHMDDTGDHLHEIDRDRETESTLRTQLDDALTAQFRASAAALQFGMRATTTPQHGEARLENPAALLETGEAWLAFMMHTVPTLQAMGWEISIDPSFPYRIVSADSWYADLQANRRPEWFDLQLGVMVDGQPVNLLPALVSYLQGAAFATNASAPPVGDHCFVRLEDGRHLPVPMERIRRIADTLVELFDRDSLNSQHALTLPVNQVSRLAQLALESSAPAFRSDDPSLLGLIDELKDFSGIRPLPAPGHFPATLRPYQQEGLAWLQFLRRCRVGGILADDMGLGKTVQTLAHLAMEKAAGRLRKPSLIVAPVSVLGNWQQEIRRFTPELVLLTLHGPKRKDLFASIDKADIVITGYPLLQLDSEILLTREFYFLILDEAQTIKNPRAKVSQAARALHAEHRLCLTGTPMENHLGELWSLFDFVQPGLLGDERQFQRHYRTPIEKDGSTTRARALSRRIAPFLLRRTKDAVARELPPKIHIVESIVLEESQRDFYDGIRLGQHRRVREAIQNHGLARSHITVLDALLKLRQACCDPRLVTGDSRLVSADAPTHAVPSAKLDWLSTALPELIAEGRRILLFSQFTSMLRLIATLVTELSIPYCELTGETQHRTPLIERFQSGAVPLFLISLKAGGTGLNLTAADTVIHYDPWWNPAVEAQATDRAHRIGQDKSVFVYKLIAQGTVEEKIMQLQADKHALASQLYTGENVSPTQLNAADLETLFAP